MNLTDGCAIYFPEVYLPHRFESGRWFRQFLFFTRLQQRRLFELHRIPIKTVRLLELATFAAKLEGFQAGISQKENRSFLQSNFLKINAARASISNFGTSIKLKFGDISFFDSLINERRFFK